MIAQSRLFSWLPRSHQCHTVVIRLTGQSAYSSLWESRCLLPLLAEEHSGNKKSVVRDRWHLLSKDPPDAKKQAFSLPAYPCLLSCSLAETSAKLWSSVFLSWTQVLQPELNERWHWLCFFFFFPCCFPKVILMKGHRWTSRKSTG